MTSGSCGVALASENIILDTSSPYKVSGKTSIQPGYSQGFCYSCKVKPVGGTTSISFNSDLLKIDANEMEGYGKILKRH